MRYLPTHASDIYSELKEFGHVKSRATLGVGVTEIKDNFYLEDGLYVSKVLDDSSAQKAGIQKVIALSQSMTKKSKTIKPSVMN